MTNRVQTLQDEILTEDFTESTELSTSNLDSSFLEPIQEATSPNLEVATAATAVPADTDWLRVLSARSTYTEPLEDELPEPQPRPSGMVQHASAPRIRPTIWARLTTALKRGTLLLVLSALAVSVLAAGGYAISTTPWFSTVLAPPPSAPAPEQQAPANPQPDSQTQPNSTGNAPGSGTISVTNSGDPDELLNKGIEQYKLGNYDEAVTMLESAVDVGGGDAVTYYQLGLAYLAVADREHSLEDAELAFRTAIALQPTWAAPHQLLAESLLRRGFAQDAIDPANQAVQLDPSQSEAWMTLGRAYQGAGRDADATRAFAEAAHHAPPPPSKP